MIVPVGWNPLISSVHNAACMETRIKSLKNLKKTIREYRLMKYKYFCNRNEEFCKYIHYALNNLFR